MTGGEGTELALLERYPEAEVKPILGPGSGYPVQTLTSRRVGGARLQRELITLGLTVKHWTVFSDRTRPGVVSSLLTYVDCDSHSAGEKTVEDVSGL